MTMTIGVHPNIKFGIVMGTVVWGRSSYLYNNDRRYFHIPRYVWKYRNRIRYYIILGIFIMFWDKLH